MKDPLDTLSQENIESFRDGYTEVTLKAGTLLHRFTQGEGAPVFSDCWIDHETFTKTVSDIQRMASELGTASDHGRKRIEIWEHLAILSVWNRLSHQVKISLKNDVIAYVGQIGPQSLYMAADARSGLPTVTGSTCHEVRSHFSGTVTALGGTPPGVRYVLLKSHTGRQTERFDHLTRVDVQLHSRVEKGQLIGQSAQATQRTEYRRGGLPQVVIPRFRNDEELRKLRGFATNWAADILVNKLIFG